MQRRRRMKVDLSMVDASDEEDDEYEEAMVGLVNLNWERISGVVVVVVVARVDGYRDIHPNLSQKRECMTDDCMRGDTYSLANDTIVNILYWRHTDKR